MDIAQTPAIERIARVLTGQRLSINGEGDDAHAAGAVDRDWAQHRDDAVAVLKTLRDPDESMAAAGDVATWQRMILAALGDQNAGPADHDPPAPGHRSPS